MALDLIVRPVGFYKVNCYLVSVVPDGAVEAGGNDGPGGDAVVIDPGDEAEAILDLVRARGLEVRAVLLTHGHWDHVGAVADVAEATGAPVYLHEADLALLEEWSPRPVPAVRFLQDGGMVEAGGLSLEAWHTPGHTPGGLCYRLGGWLFSGDTLFAGSVGRTDFPGGSPEELARSLRRLLTLPDGTTVYPGHGPATTIGRERVANPFLSGL